MEFNNSIKSGAPVLLCECFSKLNLYVQFKIKLGIMKAYILFGALCRSFPQLQSIIVCTQITVHPFGLFVYSS